MSEAPPRPAGRLDRLTSPGGMFVGAVLLIAAWPVTSPIRDPDFWWHLRTGQLLIDRGGLLATDPYTYTVPNHVWVMHEWLTEVWFAAMYRVGGLGLIVAALSLVSWIGILLIAARAGLRPSGPFVFGGGMVLGVLAGYPIWGPRAQMITFTLACLVLYLSERHLVRGGRAIWLLVPLFVVWSNLHSGFIIGLGFMAVILAGEAGGRLLHWSGGAPAERVRTLLWVLLACLGAGALNVNGPGIILYPFGTQGSPAQQSLILEWHSPDFHDGLVRIFGAMLISLLAMIVINRKIRARDAALVLATVALAFQSVRHIALFVAACTPVWIDQAQLLRSRLRPPRRRPLPPRAFRLVVSLLLALLLIGIEAGYRIAPAVATQEDSLTYADDFPVCASVWLAQLPGGLHIFNQYGEGGYLAWKLSARGDKVFIFGDAALMGDDLLTTYGRVEGINSDWDSIIESAGTDLVVFDQKTPLASLLAHDSRWVEVYSDPHNVIYVPIAKRDRWILPPPPQTSACRALAEQQAAQPTGTVNNS